MPRAAFKAHLEEAANRTDIRGISQIQPTGADEFEFYFTPARHDHSFKISVVLQDVSDYPLCYKYEIFCSDDTPPHLAFAITKLPKLAQKPITHLLSVVSKKLGRCIDDDGDIQMQDTYAEEEEEDEDEDEESELAHSDDECFGLVTKDLQRISVSRHNINAKEAPQTSNCALTDRVRSDLGEVKAAGFRVGYYGDILGGAACTIAVSCRISKLGISEEALRAWQLPSEEYLVLLIHFPNGYKPIGFLVNPDPSMPGRNVEFRTGVSKSYKPSRQETTYAFSSKVDKLQHAPGLGTSHFRDCFISRPLNDLMQTHLIKLIKYRLMGMPWSGAEKFFYDSQGSNSAFQVTEEYQSQPQKELDAEHTFPKIVTADHIGEGKVYDEHSFPLIAMQFLLRHFVRCNEFCLVCHRSLDDGIEATKPYVCNTPLCLYQYLSLGFGPSIEQEIISQPYVVDLLVSVCYEAAKMSTLKEFPVGLYLKVLPESEKPLSSRQTPKKGYWDGLHSFRGRLDPDKADLIIDQTMSYSFPVKPGDWIALCSPHLGQLHHYRVTNTSSFPIVNLSNVAAVTQLDNHASIHQSVHPPSTSRTALPSMTASGTMEGGPNDVLGFIYNKDFDKLADHRMAAAIASLIETLPNVREMRDYLLCRPSASLGEWDRIVPAALGVLRWIIASNRACIIQESGLNEGQQMHGRPEDRLYGTGNCLQFRFAMGAPDKEQRFAYAVETMRQKLNPQYPTIFAWHGSPLHNWHAIIREGLHFKNVINGRSCGNGVYHSLDFNTSAVYASGRKSYAPLHCWPQSLLHIKSAVALNEIVNAPSDFVCTKPHLVVNQVDWIQTRYLIVTCNNATNSGIQDMKSLEALEQDPNMTPVGNSGERVVIPLAAIPRSRRSAAQALDTKKNIPDASSLDRDEDTASVDTLPEDLDVFPDETQADHLMPTSSNVLTYDPVSPATDFVPGRLDYKSLPRLKEPEWATSSASKRLQQEFLNLLKVQKSQPLHELGWYVDPKHLNNVYQWIVELHSFESTLPLARDMKAKGITSIVLEFRFGKDFPISPPFVRVVRPRFLPFAAGGGGHVTAGGALCMELLTNTGWRPVMSIESVLIQIRLAISSTDPQPARLENGLRRDYNVREATLAFTRACTHHGWAIPKVFEEIRVMR